MREALVREGVREAQRPEAALPAKPHVCFVAPHLWPVLSGDGAIREAGGAEVQQGMLVRLFARHGYRVSVVTQDYGQPQRVEVAGATVHKAFRSGAGLPVLRFLHPRLTTMWRRLAEVNADIYYYRSTAMWVGVVAAFCRRHGKRLVYAGASDKDFVPGQGGQVRYARDRWLYEQGLRAADAIVAQNAAQVATCREHYGREAVLIPSTYELPAARDAAAVRDRVLWVGMMQPGKRPELFLELARAAPHRRFVMIGGPRAGADALFERVRAEAAQLPNVEFKGFLPPAQAEPWFDRARVVLNTSVWEGMPNTFLQAWARGVPTLATVDVGAPVHQVFGDAAEGAAAIERLFTDDAHHAAAARRCREYFERVHSSKAVLRKYAEVFAKVLQ